MGQNPTGKVTIQIDAAGGGRAVRRFLGRQSPTTLAGGRDEVIGGATVSIPSLGPESCLRVSAGVDKVSGSNTVTFRIHYGAVSVASPAFSTNNVINYNVLICNAPGMTNEQTLILNGSISGVSLINTQIAAGTVDGTTAQDVKVTGSGTAGDQIVLSYFLVEAL